MGPGTAAEAAFLRDRHGLPAAFDRLAEDFLRESARVAVGGVEHVDAGFKADVDQSLGLGDVARPPGLEEFIAAAEGTGAEGERRNHEARCAELPVFQSRLLV